MTELGYFLLGVGFGLAIRISIPWASAELFKLWKRWHGETV